MRMTIFAFTGAAAALTDNRAQPFHEEEYGPDRSPGEICFSHARFLWI